MDVVLTMDVSNYFSFDLDRAKKIRKLAILSDLIGQENKLCKRCLGEGTIEHSCFCELCERVDEECPDCYGSGTAVG